MLQIEISVLPVAALRRHHTVRACCQRLASPMMAMIGAGKGLRNRLSIRGETGSWKSRKRGVLLKDARSQDAGVGAHVIVNRGQFRHDSLSRNVGIRWGESISNGCAPSRFSFDSC